MRRLIVFTTTWIALSTSGLRAAEPSWSAKMQQLSQVLPELLVDVSKENSLQNRSTLARVKKNTAKLAELSHRIAEAQKKKKGGPLDADPSIGMLSVIFEDEAKHAQIALNQGHLEYARSMLLSISSYCISCHTRTDFGPKFPVLKLDAKTDSLTTGEKADLFSATRQFDRALAEYEKIILDPKVMQENPFEWERAVKKMLAICVRVNKDPSHAIKVLKKIPKNTTSVGFLDARLKDWITSLEAWKKNPKGPLHSKTPLGKAKALMSAARGLQVYPADESGAVYYLRASAELHEVLRKKLPPRTLAEAFMLTGMAYESIDELKLWSLPEVYYQSCIRTYPHSTQAEHCYDRFEENIYTGYTGSSGTHLPEDVRKKLQELRQEATKKAK
ncbi:MAG: hypothetical protein KDD39_14980 [Bdellovibrionales bacterium]|nr:hypothetical protein [Bdellovibrionales bacterium]